MGVQHTEVARELISEGNMSLKFKIIIRTVSMLHILSFFTVTTLNKYVKFQRHITLRDEFLGNFSVFHTHACQKPPKCNGRM